LRHLFFYVPLYKSLTYLTAYSTQTTEEITGNAVKVGADGDGGVVTDGPEMSGDVLVPMLAAQVLPHGTASFHQCVLQQIHRKFIVRLS